MSAAGLPPLIEELRDPARYRDSAARVELVETHISWVLLTGSFAYKIKKPVNLGFLDFSTLEARRHYCEEELRLNRRTAPELYVAVVPISGTSREPAIGGAGAAIEYAVKMRQFDQNRLLDRVAKRGELSYEHVDALARTVAEFHSRIDASSRTAPAYASAAGGSETAYVRKRVTTGAKYASAIPKLPNSMGPDAPNRARHICQIATIRSMSRRTAGLMPLPGCRARMLTGMAPRKSRKPACISAQIERAMRRACGSSGHSALPGYNSATVSQIASVSHTGVPSTSSTGTRPVGE